MWPRRHGYRPVSSSSLRLVGLAAACLTLAALSMEFGLDNVSIDATGQFEHVKCQAVKIIVSWDKDSTH
jgi:hypothetical protein